MFSLFIIFLSVLCISLLIADGIRTSFSFSYADWAPRALPWIAVLALAVISHCSSPGQFTPALSASFLCLLDAMLVMRPATGYHPVRCCTYVAGLTLAAVSSALLLPSMGWLWAICLTCPLSALAVFVMEICSKHSPLNLMTQNITTWAGVQCCSQMLGMLALTMVLVILLAVDLLWNGASAVIAAVMAVALSAAYVYLYWRGSLGVPFIVRSRYARARKTPAFPLPESSTARKTPEDKMKELYARVEEFMNKNQPYLDYTFTLTDLAASLYVNKTFLSKTINKLSDYNFCQYVNKYRVDYAISLMKKDPVGLKVTELAFAAGFNSVVSFNMAFRLFQEDTPSEYMRTLRARRLERGQ